MTSPIETNFGTISGIMDATVTDTSGITPLNVIRMQDPWQVNVSWHLDGFLASMLAGEWILTLYMESIGPQAEFVVPVPLHIPFSAGVVAGNPTTLQYNKVISVPANTPADEGVYKLAVVLTCKTPAGTPGPFAGFVQAPLLQFFHAS